jgi:hypothetical protein
VITFAEELMRLEDRVPASNRGLLTLVLNAECPQGAAKVIELVKEALLAVVTVRENESDWPDLAQWRRILPRWFVDACPPEMSREAALAWLEQWRSLSPTEQAEEEKNQQWALADWLHWFAPGPDERQWRWLGGTSMDQTRIQVVVQVGGYPTAYGALTWLLRAAGALDIREA